MTNENMTVYERLQERVKRLINERNMLRAEVNRLDPTGDTWQRTQSDLEAWKQAYVRTRVQRDELLAVCEAMRLAMFDFSEDFDQLKLLDQISAAIAKVRGA